MCLRMNTSSATSPTDSTPGMIYKRSRSCSHASDIDSRIARAMDLVKTHMLSSVREEVEPLMEKIKNLTERNIELEKENHLLRLITKYQTALTSGQITNHQTAWISSQITNHQTALTSGQISNHQTALTSEQITNQQAALASGQISNHQTALTSEKITNQQAALASGQISNHQTTLTSNRLCSQHDFSKPEQSEHFIFRNVDYQTTGCFSVNTQLHLNVARKQDVRCV